MTDKFKFPEVPAAVFWPVGTGDSTSLVVSPGKVVMQLDLRHLEKSENEEEPEWPIIDTLVRCLPKLQNGTPYLSCFALTHPDADHIQGFRELLDRVHIGELWHTPRIFENHGDDELCEDAGVFKNEVSRRLDKILSTKSYVESGDRLRVIGYDEEFEKDEKYKQVPSVYKSYPGQVVSILDGFNLEGQFEAFIHAPFKDDISKDKNKSSLAMNVELRTPKSSGRFFFFGDREYQTIKRIFVESEAAGNASYLDWDVMLSSHHCSKSVMYYEDEPGEGKKFKKDIMDYFFKYKRTASGYVVASSHSKFSDKQGDNPPHKKAREKYEGIVEAGRFQCTHEYPTKSDPQPMIFPIGDEGIGPSGDGIVPKSAIGLGAAVGVARGQEAPPSTQIGFGT
ncbi:hypothetical protein OAU50_03370 [Planctomycetota bacterium]|nr:hypothetical protein [Planctomycetota bacterium]